MDKVNKPPLKNPHSKWGFFFVVTEWDYLSRRTKRFWSNDISIVTKRRFHNRGSSKWNFFIKEEW